MVTGVLPAVACVARARRASGEEAMAPTATLGIRAENNDQADQPSRGVSPFEQAYRGLLRGLYEGRFVPGQRLSAPDLMQEFNVGRGTIREVLHRLTSSGVVALVPNRGAMVRRLSRREVDEVLDIIELLLGLAARRAAAAVAVEGQAEALRLRRDDVRNAIEAGDFQTFLEAREAYYRFVVALGGNRELQRLFPGAQVHIMRIQLRGFERAADSNHISDYAELTDAILSGDPATAETAARRHVGFTRDRVAKLPDKAFSRPSPV